MEQAKRIYDPEEKWKKIKEANDLIQTRELKGKQYAEVKERVIAFRRVHPLGQILTELSFSENYANCQTTILDEDGVILATGHAREYLKNDFAVEKCETSSVGRALGLCGYGINTSIASAEDVENVGKSEIFDFEFTNQEYAVKLKNMLTKQEYADLLNFTHVLDLDKLPNNLLSSIFNYVEEKHSTGK